MKNRLCAIFVAAVVAVAAYIAVSTAAKHYAIDEIKLHAFHMEYNAVHH